MVVEEDKKEIYLISAGEPKSPRDIVSFSSCKESIENSFMNAPDFLNARMYKCEFLAEKGNVNSPHPVLEAIDDNNKEEIKTGKEYYILTGEHWLEDFNSILRIDDCKTRSIHFWSKNKILNSKIFIAILREDFSEEEIQEAFKIIKEKKEKEQPLKQKSSSRKVSSLIKK